MPKARKFSSRVLGFKVKSLLIFSKRAQLNLIRRSTGRVCGPHSEHLSIDVRITIAHLDTCVSNHHGQRTYFGFIIHIHKTTVSCRGSFNGAKTKQEPKSFSGSSWNVRRDGCLLSRKGGARSPIAGSTFHYLYLQLFISMNLKSLFGYWFCG